MSAQVETITLLSPTRMMLSTTSLKKQIPSSLRNCGTTRAPGRPPLIMASDKPLRSTNLEANLRERDDIISFTDFESKDWIKDWSGVGHAENISLVDSNSSEHLNKNLNNSIHNHMLSTMSRLLAPAIALLTAVAHAENAAVYHEKYRPQIHFSPKKDWMNDPNGLIHLDGTYHMFFQHRKTKHWGHATSSDLLHWSEQPIALAPHEGHQVYSGCAVFDAKNTSGLGTTANPPLVAIYSSWGEGQCLAFSNDKSKTWSRYDQNPVLNLPDDEKKSYPLSARDPNVIWHPETNRWVMLLYQNVHRKLDPALPRDAQGGFGIFSSTNLKDWKFESHLPGFYVCPDIFELPVVGEPGVKKWVLMDWAQYGIGHFDGKRFTLESKPRKLDHGKNLSANQTWKNMPDGDSRRIQISWLRGGKYPGMPFDQQMSIPVELTLRRVGGELTLCKTPIRELSRLVDNVRDITPGKLSRDRAVELKTDRHSLDIAIKLHLSTSSEALIEVLGQPIRITRDTIECMGSKAVWSDKSQALLDLRIITDRTSLEIFANGGATTMSFCLLAPETPAPIKISAPKGNVDVHHLKLGTLKSIWSEQ